MKKLKRIINLPKTIIYLLCALTAISLINLTDVLADSHFASATSDITYQKTIDQEFTINPSINVSLSSSNLIINDLIPGQSTDSNIITINVESNNKTGYVLSSSVGNNTTYNTDALVNNSGSTIATFANMTTAGNLSAGEWGYSYATTTIDDVNSNDSDNSNTTWNWSTYAGLPLYSSTAATLATDPTNGTTAVQFKIGAYADPQQPSGEYTNIINFTVVGNATPTTLYQAFYEASKTNPSITQKSGYYKMQDMSPEICSAVQEIPSEMSLIDVRDDEVYLIGKLADGRCWMKDNLRLGSNDHVIDLTPEDTNITTKWTLPQGIISEFTGYDVAHINATHKNDTSVISYGNSSGRVGVYYNYCAVSAKTYCYTSDAGIGDARYDICPTNWRLPTGGTSGEYQALYNQYDTTQVATNPGSLQYNLAITLTGLFWNSTHYDLDASGLFPTSTYSTSQRMYGLYTADSQVLPTDGGGRFNRDEAHPVRCIANN